MGFLGAVHSELVKVKHTPFWTMHLCLPVVGALLFIVYYDEYGNIYIAVDTELKGRIRTALMEMILKFEVEVV